MISEDLQQAIDGLEIRDLYIREQFARCLGEFDPKYEDDMERLTLQDMHVVRKSSTILVDNEERVLQVFVRLGVRWVDPDEEKEEDSSIRAVIEAEFVAEYLMKDELSQESVDSFALQNVSYHVWPYWREFVSNQCTRMHLPKIMLPVVQLAQNRNRRVKKES